MSNTEFRHLCEQEYKERADKIEAKKSAELIEENQQRNKALRDFLSLRLALSDFDLDLDAVVKDAAYEGDGFALTVGSKEQNFNIQAGRACIRCKEVHSFKEVKDFADIGEIIADSPNYTCPKCEEAQELADREELESFERISDF